MKGDKHYLNLAIEEARKAFEVGEFPVGAVLVDPDGNVISKSHNKVYSSLDPTAHAEINAIREAARRIGNYQLNELRMYVTLEPCIMCASALVLARISELVYVVREPRFGGVYSLYQIPTDIRLNHNVKVRQVDYGQDEILAMMKEYFKKLR